MFQFPRLPSLAYAFSLRILSHHRQWVPPFGHPRIDARLQLPEAFRRSPRPSSAPSA